MAWHRRPGAFQRLTPPWQSVRLEHFDGVRPGDRAVIRLGPDPVALRWVAEHQSLTDGIGFVDKQIDGPFAAWRHEHRMIPNGPSDSTLEDRVTFEPPGAPLTRPLAEWIGTTQLRRMFAYRHRVTRADLRRHAALQTPPATIAVTGSTGMVGEALCALLLTGGHRVVRVVRSRDEALRLNRSALEKALYWNPEEEHIDFGALQMAAPGVVIHLAGEPVYGIRWTTAKKRRIWESRTRGTQLLARALAHLSTPPRLFISASAGGVYGDAGSSAVTEETPTGAGFLAGVCRAWEASTAEAEAAGIRTVHARIGLVMSPAGGMLGMLLPAAHLGLGAVPGDGSAYWPWIALDDLLYAMLHLISDDASAICGPVNLSAPAPLPAKAVMQTLGEVIERPAGWSMPETLVRSLGGEMAEELALKSIRMMPERLQQSGFTFTYPDLESALRHLLGRTDAPLSTTAPAS